MYKEIGYLTTQVNWLKKNLGSKMTKQERFNLVDSKDPENPITKQAELLNINRSSLYYRKVMASLKNLS